MHAVMTRSDSDDSSVFACPPVSERHVQALWYDGRLRPDGLRTVGGAPVRVLEPGVWNLERGPDFHKAVVEVGGRLLRGDVEIGRASCRERV